MAMAGDSGTARRLTTVAAISCFRDSIFWFITVWVDSGVEVRVFGVNTGTCVRIFEMRQERLQIPRPAWQGRN